MRLLFISLALLVPCYILAVSVGLSQDDAVTYVTVAIFLLLIPIFFNLFPRRLATWIDRDPLVLYIERVTGWTEKRERLVKQIEERRLRS